MNKLQSNCMYQCVNLLSVISLYQNFSVLIIGGKKKKKKERFFSISKEDAYTYLL